MKKFLKLTLAGALMLCSSSVFAQKFGRVDLAVIIPNMAEYKEASANLETYAKDLQDQLEAIQGEFNTRLADFEKNAGTMTDSVKQLKETELGQLQQRYRDFSQIAQQDLSKKEQELMLPVFDKANEAVKKISQAGGYLVVFNTSNSAAAGLAYFDEAALTDITDAVKRELNVTEDTSTAN